MIVGSSRCSPDAFAPAHARRFVASLCQHLPADAYTTVSLLTSELVTNAVFHGLGEVQLDLRIDERLVRVGVADAGGGEVAIAGGYRWPEGGHGLRVVKALSGRWGVELIPDSPGKRVWFELPIEAPSELRPTQEDHSALTSGLPTQPVYEFWRDPEPSPPIEAPADSVVDPCPCPMSNGGIKPPCQGP
jgi:hypothetical protein